jgi:hypothetical protein
MQRLMIGVWFALLAALFGPASNAISAPPGDGLAEQPASTIGYPTVEAALQDLRSRPGVVISERGGWTLVEDEAAQTFWSFPPPGHPAYPSAVKRQVVHVGGDLAIQMRILCQASKIACDDLVREFEKLNEQMKQSFSQPHP